MKPERFLGSDPTPGHLASIDEMLSALRETVTTLGVARRSIERTVAPDTIWHGSQVQPVVGGLTALAGRLRALEDALIDFTTVWQDWRQGVATRQDRTAELVEEMTQLAGQVDAEPRRDAVRTRARGLATEHDEGARSVVAAADELAVVLAAQDERSDDLAAALTRGLYGLQESVERWVQESADDLRRALESSLDIAEVTGAATELVGVHVGPGGVTSERAWQLAAVAPGSHRLQQALRRDWSEFAPAELPAASFEPPKPATGIGDRIRGLLGDSSRDALGGRR